MHLGICEGVCVCVCARVPVRACVQVHAYPCVCVLSVQLFRPYDIIHVLTTNDEL
eukprot:m.237657 g.237657  ORF g.237657 m.237657 type:complete len:55 (-) comp19377_c1_seq4:946-1110(-)